MTEKTDVKHSYPVARLFSQNDVNKVTAAAEAHESTPILELKHNLPSEFNTWLACSITNEKWKQRWRSMCSTQTENILGELDESDEERKVRQRDMDEKGERWRAAPTFLEEECNLTKLCE